MKSRSNTIIIAVLLFTSMAFSSCFGRMYRASVANDRIKMQNGTYHKKHYHGNHQWY